MLQKLQKWFLKNLEALSPNKRCQELKFIPSEKAKELCKISTLDLTGTKLDKSTVEILQNFVAFSEYMNFDEELLSEI